MRRSMFGVAGAMVLAVELAQPTTARADDRWYGWQTLATDGGGYLMLAGGSVSDNDAAIYTGLALYGLGGPAVHAYHEEYGRAGLSLGLRVGLPLAGGFFAGKVLCDEDEHPDEWFACLGEFFVGIMVGAVAAQVTDAAVLAYTDEPTTAQPLMFKLGGSF